MIGNGKCPKCEKPVDHADFQPIPVGDRSFGPLHRGVSIVCPACKTVLGVSIDPISLKEDTVDEVLEALGHKRKQR